jgi:hypothetical protein
MPIKKPRVILKNLKIKNTENKFKKIMLSSLGGYEVDNFNKCVKLINIFLRTTLQKKQHQEKGGGLAALPSNLLN